MDEQSEKRKLGNDTDYRFFEVWVVIVNYLSYSDTIQYVNSLFTQKKVVANVVIVDNRSPNDSLAQLRSAFSANSNVYILASDRNGGYSYGNNIGLRFIESRVAEGLVIISNNDITLKDDYFLYKCILQYQDLPNNRGFAAPLMCTKGQVSSRAARKLPGIRDEIVRASVLLSTVFGNPFHYEFNGLDNIRVDCLPGSFFMGSLEVFQKINYFDEELFLFGEERLIAKKVKDKGLTNYVFCSLSYHHDVSKTIDSQLQNLQKVKLRNFGKLLYWKKYMMASSFLVFLFRGYFKACELEIRFVHFLKKHLC